MNYRHAYGPGTHTGQLATLNALLDYFEHYWIKLVTIYAPFRLIMKRFKNNIKKDF